MKNGWFARIINFILCLVLVLLVVGGLDTGGAKADDRVLDTDNVGSMTFTLYADEYAITQDKQGLDVVQMEGFSSTTSPGDPMLPHKVYNIAVPPDIVWSSLKLNIVLAETIVLDGIYDIRPAPPILPGTNDTEVEEAVQKKETINDRNMEVYGTDAEFPESYVELLPYSQMRKWKYIRVDFTPFQYNPVSQKLTLIQSATIEITYEQSGIEPQAKLMNDTVMDDVAAQVFFNYQQVKSMYKPGAMVDALSVTYDYVIITTNAIEANSSKLASFISHKENQGHSVLVITEDEFGGLAGQSPNHKAEKIRKWLIDNYAAMGIEYVLLVGDPHPYESGEGDIPMKMCHPEMNQTEFECEQTPTDYFYADLTGNWDYDGDGYYGEWNDDYPVSGGVDFAPEVYVGRIPVYGADYTTLDSILQKIIDYETEASVAWRESALLPMGFQEEGYDGAAMAEQMIDDYLNTAGFSSWRMYQQGNGACGLDSIYASEEELRGGTVVRDRWAASDYGIVCWWAHGSQTSAGVGYPGCSDGILFQSSYCSSLDDDHPSFTYQCSCTNGYPEDSNNLQYAILKQGGIGTVSATRVSWFSSSVGYGEFDGNPTNSGIGYEYVSRLVSDNPAGQALYSTKQSMNPDHQCLLMNWYGFNLYGDPTTSLASQGGEPDITVSPTSFEVTLPPDTTGEYTLTIGNDGDAELAFNISDEETLGMTAPAPAGDRMPNSPTEQNTKGPNDILLQIPSASEPASLQRSFDAGYDDALKYDDGIGDQVIRWLEGGEVSLAVRFTPLSYPSSLQTVWIHLDSGTHAQFMIEVWDDAGADGYPGTILGSTTTTATNWGWSSIDISGMGIIIPSGDFYVAYLQMADAPNCEFISVDLTDCASRSWVYDIDWAVWHPAEDDAFWDPNWMIRCQVDDVGDCPWLSVSPTSGSVQPGNSATITVTIDTTGLAEGNYSAEIVIANNDPDENPASVAVTLTIAAANTPPQVTNVTASQGSPTVDITYDVFDAEQSDVTISFEYWDSSSWQACTTTTGEGTQSTGTGKSGTWNAKAQLGAAYISGCKVKVTADDGAGDTDSEESNTFDLDTAPPTGYGCTSPEDEAECVSVDEALVCSTASDDSAPIEYKFAIASDVAFSQDLQESGWQQSTNWTPTTALSYGNAYWWRVKARDAKNNESAWSSPFTFVTIYKFDLALKTGWNMISLPLESCTGETDPDVILPDVKAIYIWNCGTMSYDSPTEIIPRKGYWALVFEDVTETIYGIPVEEYQLSSDCEGWHMIGSLYVDGQVNVDSGSVYCPLYHWDPVTRTYIGRPCDDVISGEGYWLLAFTDFSISVGPKPPVP